MLAQRWLRVDVGDMDATTRQAEYKEILSRHPYDDVPTLAFKGDTK